MARKHWAPLAHGFNRDPQVRELRQKYGDWMALIWLELIAIGDLNDGVVKGEAGQIADSLAYISMRNRPSLASKSIRNALGFMQVSGWIRIETDRVLIVNHAKYKVSRDTNYVPTYLPDLPTRPIKTDGAKAPPVDNSKKEGKPDSESKAYETPTERAELTDYAKRIAGADVNQVHTLLKWVGSMLAYGRNHGEPVERTVAVSRATLRAFEKQKAKGRILNAWGLLSHIYDGERTRYIQEVESQQHKKGAINGAVLELVKGIG